MPRTYELSTRANVISRSDGRSATAAAAYRACCSIDDERQGLTHDYTRKSGLEAAEIVLPAAAPSWGKDRSKLWNAAETRERNKDPRAKTVDRANAQTAREFFFAYPVELSAAGRLTVARNIARHLADKHGLAVDFAIHQPGRQGDERNFHCHMLTTTRRLTAKGLGAKAREWDDLKGGPKLVKALRETIAVTMNDELKAEGKADAVHVEHRSFKARGSSQKATRHQGPAKTHEARRQRTEARRQWFQTVQQEQTDRQGRELVTLRNRQAGSLREKAAELAHRGREAAATIRQEVRAANAADRGPQGLRKVFLMVTGRAGREAFDRQTRHTLRAEMGKTKLAEIRAELRTERATYKVMQGNERAAMVERHGKENVQLRQALASREGLDRSAERVGRRGQVQERELVQEYVQEQGRGRTIGELRL